MKPFTLFKRSRSPFWHVSYNDNGKRRQIKTELSTQTYSEKEATRIFAEASGNKPQVTEYSLEWFRKYIINRLETEDRSPNTIRQYRQALDKLVAFYGSNQPMTGIQKPSLFPFKEYLLTTIGKTNKKTKFTPGPITVNTNLAYIHSAFNILVKEDIIEKNPFLNYKKLPVRKTEIDYLSEEQLKAFVKVLNNDPKEFRRIVRILIYTGLRLSEPLNLHREEIDLDNKRIYVINAKSRDKHKRWIPVHSNIIDDFRYFLSSYPLKNYPLKICHTNTISHYVKKLMTKAGFDNLNTKTLRHSYATNSILKGIPIRTVQKMLDHSSTQVTEIYSHDKIYDHPVDFEIE